MPTTVWAVVTPIYPGDIVCARYHLRMMAEHGPTVAIVPHHLQTLINDLPILIVSYNQELTERETEIKNLVVPSTTVVDHICTPKTVAFLKRIGGIRVGTMFPDLETDAYHEVLPWKIGSDDHSHYSVRLARALPERRNSTTFDSVAWRRSAYQILCTAIPKWVALSPGCARAAAEQKRFPVQGWVNLALWLRKQGYQPVWFLGPDETEIFSSVVISGDMVESGDWQTVIKTHSQCSFGISNDTVHMHIRAHLNSLLPSLAIIRNNSPHEWATEWAAYPANIKWVECTPNTFIQVTINKVIDIVEQEILIASSENIK